ncbi:MAG: DoxX family protein [Taibaiella sp.]|nr:DoxX family protein [Taibaiella sp.]
MKNNNIAPSNITLNLALLILRLGAGILMMPHGYDKFIHFSEIKTKFIQFLGLSASISLGLNIFAELFCSILLIVGLFTRLAAIPLIIAMGVALFMAQGGDLFGKGQPAALFLLCFIIILLAGPGTYSLDRYIKRKQ